MQVTYPYNQPVMATTNSPCVIELKPGDIPWNTPKDYTLVSDGTIAYFVLLIVVLFIVTSIAFYNMGIREALQNAIKKERR